MAIQFIQPLLAPVQVISFLKRCLQHVLAGLFILRGKSLALVKCLCTYFAHVINSHQTGNMFAFRFVEFRLFDGPRRVGTLVVVYPAKRTNCTIESGYQIIYVKHRCSPDAILWRFQTLPVRTYGSA